MNPRLSLKKVDFILIGVCIGVTVSSTAWLESDYLPILIPLSILLLAILTATLLAFRKPQDQLVAQRDEQRRDDFAAFRQFDRIPPSSSDGSVESA